MRRKREPGAFDWQFEWCSGQQARSVAPRCSELIENPDYPTGRRAGVRPGQGGTDAGALCGLPPTTGVMATADKDAIVALGADVVVHAASKAHAIETNAEDICRLLAAGTNVITTTSYNHLPTYGADIEAAVHRRVRRRWRPASTPPARTPASCSNAWSRPSPG